MKPATVVCLAVGGIALYLLAKKSGVLSGLGAAKAFKKRRDRPVRAAKVYDERGRIVPLWRQTRFALPDPGEAAQMCADYGGNFLLGGQLQRSRCYVNNRLMQGQWRNHVAADQMAITPSIYVRDPALPEPVGTDCGPGFRYFVTPDGRATCLRPCAMTCPSGESAYYNAYGRCVQPSCGSGSGPGGDGGGGGGGGK